MGCSKASAAAGSCCVHPSRGLKRMSACNSYVLVQTVARLAHNQLVPSGTYPFAGYFAA